MEAFSLYSDIAWCLPQFLDYSLTLVPEPCSGAGYVVQYSSAGIHMRHAIDLQVHESCMYVAVRVLHSCAFIMLEIGLLHKHFNLHSHLVKLRHSVITNCQECKCLTQSSEYIQWSIIPPWIHFTSCQYQRNRQGCQEGQKVNKLHTAWMIEQRSLPCRLCIIPRPFDQKGRKGRYPLP